MHAPGHNAESLKALRASSAYKELRQGISFMRLAGRVAVALLMLLTVLGGMLTYGAWMNSGSMQQLMPTVIVAAVTVAVLAGVLYFGCEFMCGVLELLADINDQSLRDSAAVATEQRTPRRLNDVHAASPPPPPLPPDGGMASLSPRIEQASGSVGSAEVKHQPVGSGAPDHAAAHALLELAQRHARAGNKTEAVRCLRELIGRYGTTEAADSARRALDRIGR
jgi:hypothetical protein